MRDDAVLRRALPLGRGNQGTQSSTSLENEDEHMTSRHDKVGWQK